jgi:hypothetical protein
MTTILQVLYYSSYSYNTITIIITTNVTSVLKYSYTIMASTLFESILFYSILLD